MKRLISLLTIVFLLGLPLQASGAPTFSGSTLFDFGGGNVATVDWSVYAPTDTGSLSGSTSEFTYQYTLNGWAGYGGGDPLLSDANLNVWTGTSAGITSFGTASTGSAPAPTAVVLPDFFQLTAAGANLTDPLNSITGWFTSSIGPTITHAQLTTGPVLNTTVGYGFDGQLIMSPNHGIPPGVPEPETWTLLFCLLGFTTWWMRRNRNDAPQETSIAA